MEQNNKNKPEANGPKMNMPRFNMNWIYFLAIMALIFLYMTSGGESASQVHVETTYSDFKTYVTKGYADKIVVNKTQNKLKMYVKAEHIRDVFNKGHQQVGTNPYIEVEIGSVDQVEKFVAAWAWAAAFSMSASQRPRCMRKVESWASPSRTLPVRPVPSRRCRRLWTF